jgi:hypothetical protein
MVMMYFDFGCPLFCFLGTIFTLSRNSPRCESEREFHPGESPSKIYTDFSERGFFFGIPIFSLESVVAGECKYKMGHALPHGIGFLAWLSSSRPVHNTRQLHPPTTSNSFKKVQKNPSTRPKTMEKPSITLVVKPRTFEKLLKPPSPPPRMGPSWGS